MRSRYVRQFAFCLCLLLIPVMVPAQTGQGTSQYEPSIGQDGKDVIWVPTAQVLVDKMLDLAQVGRSDYLLDLGSGDGRTVISAAKRGARARGIEYNPNMVALSRQNAAKEGVADRAEFVKADLFETDLSQATVITMFLLPEVNLRLRPRILGLKPGTRIVSNSFDMGENGRQTSPPAYTRGAPSIAPPFSGSCPRRSKAHGSFPGVSSCSGRRSRPSPAHSAPAASGRPSRRGGSPATGLPSLWAMPSTWAG